MGDPKEDSHPIQSDTQLTREVPTGGATTATTSPRAHTPQEETELFSTDYVDKLVASFWTKVDQKIEQAVSHYQASPQAGQQSNTHDNAHSQEAEREEENNGKNRTPFSSVCLEVQCLNCPLLIFLLKLNNTSLKNFLNFIHSLTLIAVANLYSRAFPLAIGSSKGKALKTRLSRRLLSSWSKCFTFMQYLSPPKNTNICIVEFLR